MLLLSRIRQRCGLTAFDRAAGEFLKASEDTAEPGRTERLLKTWPTFSYSRAGDAYDSLGFWLARSTGDSVSGTAAP